MLAEVLAGLRLVDSGLLVGGCVVVVGSILRTRLPHTTLHPTVHCAVWMSDTPGSTQGATCNPIGNFPPITYYLAFPP